MNLYNLQRLGLFGCRNLLSLPKYNYHFPSGDSETHHKVSNAHNNSLDSQLKELLIASAKGSTDTTPKGGTYSTILSIGRTIFLQYSLAGRRRVFGHININSGA